MAHELDLGAGYPRIHVCESLAELEKLTGLKLCHGFFDPQKFEIYATADSIAHEVGHVKDISSGLYRSPAQEVDALGRATALLRNETVAILFAYSKMGIGAANLPHEVKLVDWLLFETKRKSFAKDIQFESASMSAIQNFAQWLVEPEHAWRRHLEFIFRGYLINEQETLWYNRRSELFKKTSQHKL